MELVLITLLAFTPLIILILVGLSCKPLELPRKEHVYYDDEQVHIFILPTKMRKSHMRMHEIEYLGEL